MTAGQLQLQCNWRTPWIKSFEVRPHEDLVLAFHREGVCDVRALEGDTPSAHHSLPGQVTLLPPAHFSRFNVEGEVSFATLHIPRDRVRPVAKRHALGTQDPDFRFAFKDAFVGACIEAIVGEIESAGPKSEEFIHSVTDSLIVHLMRATARSDAPPRPRLSRSVERCLHLIASNLAAGLSLEELAEEAGVSRSHFARRFRAEIGVSPHRYQSQLRVERARQMRESRVGLVDIAMELGFCSQSHFTQVFRSLAGVTPHRFRDMRP